MKKVRSIALVGVVCAMAAAGCGGDKPEKAGTVTPAASDSAAVDALVLARVGDLPITVGDVRHHMLKTTSPEHVEHYMHNPDILKIALDSLVDQFVWAEAAKRANMDLTDDERRRVLALESELIANRYVGDVIQGQAMPERWEVEAWFNERQEEFLSPVRVAVRQILVNTEAEADALIAEARNGADFAALAREHSLDHLSRDLGGAIGYVQKDTDIPGLGPNRVYERAVLALDAGEVDKVQSPKGWHVVKVEKKEGGDLMSLDEVYDGIANQLARSRFGGIYNEALAEARDISKVEYIGESFARLTGVDNNPERLYEIAKNEPEPGSRVELYRKIAFDYPDNPRAAEAQFLIGYIRFLHSKNEPMARKALMRLQRRYPDSDWRKAGDLLLKKMEQDPDGIGSVEEIYAEANGK